MQRITTAEPDDSMIEVGIAAINAVVPHPEEKKENIEEVGETETYPKRTEKKTDIAFSKHSERGYKP